MTFPRLFQLKLSTRNDTRNERSPSTVIFEPNYGSFLVIFYPIGLTGVTQDLSMKKIYLPPAFHVLAAFLCKSFNEPSMKKAPPNDGALPFGNPMDAISTLASFASLVPIHRNCV